MVDWQRRQEQNTVSISSVKVSNCRRYYDKCETARCSFVFMFFSVSTNNGIKSYKKRFPVLVFIVVYWHQVVYQTNKNKISLKKTWWKTFDCYCVFTYKLNLKTVNWNILRNNILSPGLVQKGYLKTNYNKTKACTNIILKTYILYGICIC